MGSMPEAETVTSEGTGKTLGQHRSHLPDLTPASQDAGMKGLLYLHIGKTMEYDPSPMLESSLGVGDH